MNAKIILLVTLIGYVLAQSDVCTPVTPTCVSTNGGTCSATASPQTICDASAGLFCSGGSCAATVAANAACSLTAGANQCGYSTTQCIANSNYTDYACLGRYLNPGQTCTSDDQCYFGGNANGASNSTCVSGKCYGSVGSNCTVSYRTCPSGSSCVGAFGSAVCTATASDGACTTLGFADNTCPSGYCTSAGKCGNRFQGVSGSTCGSNDECGDGLFCALSGPNADKTCRAIFSSSGAACTIGGAACAANYESCGCNSARNTVCQAPRGNPTGYVAAATAYYTCVAANPQCSIDPWCSACQSQTCSYYKIRDGSNLGYNPSFTCQLSTAQRAQAALCKADSSSTSASSAVVASVLVASAAAFVVLA